MPRIAPTNEIMKIRRMRRVGRQPFLIRLTITNSRITPSRPGKIHRIHGSHLLTKQMKCLPVQRLKNITLPLDCFDAAHIFLLQPGIEPRNFRLHSTARCRCLNAQLLGSYRFRRIQQCPENFQVPRCLNSHSHNVNIRERLVKVNKALLLASVLRRWLSHFQCSSHDCSLTLSNAR